MKKREGNVKKGGERSRAIITSSRFINLSTRRGPSTKEKETGRGGRKSELTISAIFIHLIFSFLSTTLPERKKGGRTSKKEGIGLRLLSSYVARGKKGRIIEKERKESGRTFSHLLFALCSTAAGRKGGGKEE